MATLQGKGHVFGIPATATIEFKGTDGSTTLSGYVTTKNTQSARFTHNSDADVIKSQQGEITSVITSGESIEAQFDFVAEGTTIANAALSAQIPPANTWATLANWVSMKFGSDVTDALNDTSWLYKGGGTWNFTNDGKLTGSFTLTKYPSMTAGAVIT